MRIAACTPVVLLVLAQLGPALAAAEEPTLLVKRPACFVHALPARPACRPPYERVVHGGYELLHTSRKTGKMTRLVGPTGTAAVNTVRISFDVTRVLGVVADEERLYVLSWRSRVRDRPPEEGAPVAGGHYDLRVFRLDDGSALRAPSLGPDGLPATAPGETLGKGPLALVPGGVACFGTTARYDGTTLRGD